MVCSLNGGPTGRARKLNWFTKQPKRYYGNCVAADDDDDEWEKSCTDRMDGLHNSITSLQGLSESMPRHSSPVSYDDDYCLSVCLCASAPAIVSLSYNSVSVMYVFNYAIKCVPHFSLCPRPAHLSTSDCKVLLLLLLLAASVETLSAIRNVWIVSRNVALLKGKSFSRSDRPP